MSFSLRSIDPCLYAIARGDSSDFYEELKWFAVSEDRLLGLLLRDKMDFDYSWVIFACSQQGQYRAIDLGVSCATNENAEHALTAALERWSSIDADRIRALADSPPYEFPE
jgi:hypothetical protein